MKRYELIDTLRGLEILSMIAFHACWILSHFGFFILPETLVGTGFTVWERSICIGFISIAGFSFSLGRDHVRSGLIVFGWGFVITLVTCLFLPDIRIIFGILTFLGTCIFIMIPLDGAVRKITKGSRAACVVIFALSMVLFLLTYRINVGYIGLAPFSTKLPEWLYRNLVTTFIGFMMPGFFSTDYFSLIPWFFMYLCGYMLHKIVADTKVSEYFMKLKIPGINKLGRHSLPIYIIHPIVLYILIGALSYCMRGR